MSGLVVGVMARFVTTPQPQTTVAEIQRVQRFFGETDGVKTAFIKNKEQLSLLHGKNPYLYPPAEPILAAINNYQPISINELSWEVGDGFYAKQEAKYKRSAALFNFVHEKKLEHQSIREVQRKFMEENGIRFLEVERGAELIVPRNQVIDSLRMDNGNMVYKLAYKPIVAPD